MPTPKWLLIPALLLAACGSAPAGSGDESDTDELSSSTYSMEMLRANPSLLPGVTPPPGVRVAGHARPLALDESKAPVFPIDRHSWLYDANQLGQFLKLADPAA